MDTIDESPKNLLDILPIQIKNSSHIHPFELRHFIPPQNYGERFKRMERCLLCRESCPKSYFCPACGFHLCPTCVNKNPLSVDPRKTHEHPLTCVPKLGFIFTCDACGVGDIISFLCMCIPCCFAIHLKCVLLPRTICINRHEDRISLRLPLGSGDWSCRVCRKHVNGEYGGYSCLTCSNYVVHSKCATDKDVWDGIELDGVPEEDPKEILPFEVVDEGVIKHFGHEHNLRVTVLEEGETLNLRHKQCSACILPIYSDPCYICTHHCDFILHEVCANFLKKKRHPADSHRFTLSAFSLNGENFVCLRSCQLCQQIINGFSYESGNKSIHVQCASFQDGYVHVSHPHSELVILENRRHSSRFCSNCKRKGTWENHLRMMGCIECEDFNLCFRCLTLPKVVEHKYDKHPLSLCYGENWASEYWCDLCETRLDPRQWYYTCREGNSTLHTHCVLGEDSGYRLGYIFDKYGDIKFKVVSNSSVTRPHCHICKSRCQGPCLFKFKDLSFCSSECVTAGWECRVCHTSISGQYGLYICPNCKGSNLLCKLDSHK
ncbi:hypothetical protein V5N11_028819 [Cardamine amara subsp. amara]|uniref:Cysteine/Histidine-rich C1 domain family protein n=1 Tax=Cardamine amara subsp. amara TaxID=228776 RepID=A0ABD1BS42_CARAN